MNKALLILSSSRQRPRKSVDKAIKNIQANDVRTTRHVVTSRRSRWGMHYGRNAVVTLDVKIATPKRAMERPL